MLLHTPGSFSSEKGTRLEKFDKEDEMLKLYGLHMEFLDKWKAAASPEAAMTAIGDTKVSPAVPLVCLAPQVYVLRVVLSSGIQAVRCLQEGI